MNSTRKKLEYGDYQTPENLAGEACRLLARLGVKPRSILEPTCGKGNFLHAAVETFRDAMIAKGFDIDSAYVDRARSLLAQVTGDIAVSVERENFFDIDWAAMMESLPRPILVVGNPPWVTNSALGSVGSDNLPEKSNFQEHAGMDAVTGKSNFDISEYMLIRFSEALQGKDATLAVLCKTAVARKVMAFCWKRDLKMGDCHIFPIDAQRDFGAAVEACLFVASFNVQGNNQCCIVHQGFDPASLNSRVGYRDGLLLSDLERYEKWAFLRGETGYTWRSGVKHDCAKVMEFSEENGKLVNGFGESVDLEDEFLYPLLKSSAVAGSKKSGERWVLITQRNVGEDTSAIARVAPRTWQYLLDHAELLDKRASIIYRKRPRFCVFGIGDYSFAPWKVIISGFYKSLDFRVIGPRAERAIMLDDTSYFLGCKEEAEAVLLADLLNSPPARELLASLVFWDAKRPITVDVLKQVSIERLAVHMGKDLALKQTALRRQSEDAQADLFSDALA